MLSTVDALSTVKALLTFLKTPWPFAFFRKVSLAVGLYTYILNINPLSDSLTKLVLG